MKENSVIATIKAGKLTMLFYSKIVSEAFKVVRIKR